MKKINSSFVIPEGPKAQANKYGIYFMIFILSFIKIVYNAIQYTIFQYQF